MKPLSLLLLFCVCTLVLFSDRGIFSCNSVSGAPPSKHRPQGWGIQGEFALTLVQAGALAGVTMAGVGASALAFAQLQKRWPSFRLVGVGMACFVAGAAACAAAPCYLALLAARVLVGIGCGPFISLASPLIDDAAPAAQKSLWLACLFLCVPVGFAGGYIVGGLVGSKFGWRAPFAFEAAVMAPLAAICLLAPLPKQRPRPPAMASAASAGGTAVVAAPGSRGGLWADTKQLLRNPLLVSAVLAFSLYNGSLGGFSYWGPHAARDLFGLEAESADLLFGAVTVGTGVLGTLSGGLLLDGLGSNVRNALLLCTVGVALGAAATISAFLAASTLRPFCAAFAAGELGIFIIAAPANCALLWSVPPELRPLALALSEVSQHVFGDIPSPPLLGWLQAATGNWRLTMCACAGLLVAAALLFCVALAVRRRSAHALATLEVLVLGQGELEEELLLGQAEEAMLLPDGAADTPAPPGEQQPLLAPPWEDP